MPVGSSKTTQGVRWVNEDQLTVTFVDDATRKRSTITVSLAEANTLIGSGKCDHVTLHITGAEKVKVTCERIKGRG